MSIERSILDLIEQGCRRLVVNVSGVTSMDSAGLGMLLAWTGRMRQHHGKLRIAGSAWRRRAIARSDPIDRMAAVDLDVEAACRAMQ
ncbi:MAG: STAS domain-containing protein [Ignavibacteriota bacterium]